MYDESLSGFNNDFFCIQESNNGFIIVPCPQIIHEEFIDDRIKDENANESHLEIFTYEIGLASKSGSSEGIENMNLSPSSDTNDSSKSENLTKRKRGRKPNADADKEGKEMKNKKIHGKGKNDNRMSKIQRSYLKYLISSLNVKMKSIGLKYEFFQLNGKDIGNINKTFRDKLIKKKIKELILDTPIFGRIEGGKKDHNKNIIKKLEEEGQEIILNILDKNCLYFFENYYKNLRTFELKLSESNFIQINLPQNIELFNDLLNRNKCDNSEENEKYENDMRKCAIKYFLLIEI
jgi:hypothetical protein